MNTPDNARRMRSTKTVKRKPNVLCESPTDASGRSDPQNHGQTICPWGPTADLPTLLVVTYYAPETHHGGAVCVQRLLADYPHEKLAWAHHDQPVTDPASPWSGVEQWSVPLLQRPNRFGLTPLKELGNWTVHAPRMARRTAERARAAGVEAVLGIGPGLSVWTSHLIARRLGVPLHLWIHDDPPTHAEYRNHGRRLVERARRCFLRAYRAAAARYTISEPMRGCYHEQTGCDAVVMPPSLDVQPTPPPKRSLDQRLRIGFAGSLCGPDEWKTFLKALSRLFAGTPAERRPLVTAFADAHALPVPESARACVEVKGWQDAETVNRTLASMDFLYLPLWFSRGRRFHVTTSFSTKFVSYLAASVPVLCHVPAYSAVAGVVPRPPRGGGGGGAPPPRDGSAPTSTCGVARRWSSTGTPSFAAFEIT